MNTPMTFAVIHHLQILNTSEIGFYNFTVYCLGTWRAGLLEAIGRSGLTLVLEKQALL